MTTNELAAVKQALEALESERDKYLERGDEDGAPEDVYEAITILQFIISQDALDKKAENARELGLSYDDEPKIGCVNHDCDQCKAVQSAERGEPVAIALNTGTKQGVKWLENVEHGEKLYTTPPIVATPLAAQKPRVGLTDEQIQLVVSQAISAETLSWLGYKKDADGKYTVPVLSPSDYQFARAIEAAHGITAEPQPVPVKTYHDGKPWPVAPKPWVGLSRDEVLDIEEITTHPLAFYQAIEAKLKEKNT